MRLGSGCGNRADRCAVFVVAGQAPGPVHPVKVGRAQLGTRGVFGPPATDAEQYVSVSLTKGGNVSLTKEAPGLTNVIVGLGWDVRSTTGTDFDLDASAIIVGADGKVLSDKHFIFFNNLVNPDGTVEHTGDNLTGEGEGDDEQVKVNLAGDRK